MTGTKCAENLGLSIDDGIIADEMGRTSVPGIYAAGDVVKGNVQLAHVAMEQGKRAVMDICGEKIPPFSVVVNCIYTHPEAAAAGLTETEAKERGLAVVSGKQIMSSNARTMISTEERGFIKIVAERSTGVVLGAHMLCERASDMIAELALGINQGLTVDDFLQSVRPHPSYCEAVTEALCILRKKIK